MEASGEIMTCVPLICIHFCKLFACTCVRLLRWQCLRTQTQQLNVKFMHIHFKVNVSFLGTHKKKRDKSLPGGSAVKEQWLIPLLGPLPSRGERICKNNQVFTLRPLLNVIVEGFQWERKRVELKCVTAADRRNKGDSVIEEPSARRVKPPPRALIELSNRKTFSFTLRLSEQDLQRDGTRNVWVNSGMWFLFFLRLLLFSSLWSRRTPETLLEIDPKAADKHGGVDADSCMLERAKVMLS